MKHSECPLTYALTIVGGKWKPIIISHLKKSPKRFGKLDVLIPTISESTIYPIVRIGWTQNVK